MKKIFPHIKHRLSANLRFWKRANRSERGQVLVIVTIAMLALVAFVGLTVDVGLLYLNHGKLRRAVDAAALAASSQFREGYTHANLVNAAREFLILNGIQDPEAQVDTCTTAEAAGDTELQAQLCTSPKRKLVRVVASAPMDLAFLPVIGIHQVTLNAEAISEAASLDVVLAIDTSESMTWDAVFDHWDPNIYNPDTDSYGKMVADPMRDPAQCNPLDDCHPFKEVKEAAKTFIDQLYFPYDRVSIVTFDQAGTYIWHFSDDETRNNAAYLKGLIQNLQVYTAPVCPEGSGNPCRDYLRYEDCMYGAPWEHGNCDGDFSNEEIQDHNGDGFGDAYQDYKCPSLTGYGGAFTSNDDAHPCGTTNIGAGLRFTGNEFGGATTANPVPDPPITIRTESLWAVILLSDGAANSSYGIDDYCVSDENPICRDKWFDTRHCFDGMDALLHQQFLRCMARGGTDDSDSYDVNDFARDMADFIFDDQQALIFTIGLGPDVLRKQGLESVCDEASANYDPDECARGDNGERFLQYTADPDGEETPAGGAYYYAPDGDDLREIFLDIADKLATRLTQ